MGFPGNRPKMVQLHNNITSSKMVVRGWYMPHFDRTDLLESKKQVWGGFRNLSDLRGPICEISRFFRNFRSGRLIAKNRFFLTFESEKNFKNNFFSRFCSFPWKYATSAPFWYIYFGRTPTRSKTPRFGNLNIHFFLLMCITLFWKPLYWYYSLFPQIIFANIIIYTIYYVFVCK